MGEYRRNLISLVIVLHFHTVVIKLYAVGGQHRTCTEQHYQSRSGHANHR